MPSNSYEGGESALQFALLASENLKDDPLWREIVLEAGLAVDRMFVYLDKAGLQDVEAMEFSGGREGPLIYTVKRHYQLIRPQPERERLNE